MIKKLFFIFLITFSIGLSSEVTTLQNDHKKIQIYQTILDTLKDKSTKANYLNLIGSCYWRLENYQEAEKYYLDSYFLRIDELDTLKIINSTTNLAMVAKDKKEYKKSFNYLFYSLVLQDKISDKSAKDSIMNQLGSIFWEIKQYDEALYYFNESYMIRSSNLDTLSMINSLHNIALVHKDKSDFEQAFYYQTEALDLAIEGNLKKEKINSLKLIGNVYFAQGDYNNAELFYSESLESANEKSFNQNAAIYHNLSLVSLFLEKEQKALHYAKKCEENYRKAFNKIGLADAFFQTAEIYGKSENTKEKALEYYDKARRIYERNNDYEKIIRGNLRIIRFLDDQEPVLLQSVKIAKKSEDLSLQSITYLTLSIYYETMENIKLAKKYYTAYANTELERVDFSNQQKIEFSSLSHNSNVLKQTYLELAKNHHEQIKFIITKKIKVITGVFASILSIFSALLFFRIRKNKELRRIIYQQNIELKTVHNEIIELKEKQSQLDYKNSEITMYITANHECNQPLMVMSANLEMMEMFAKNENEESLIGNVIESSNVISNKLKEMKNIVDLNKKELDEQDSE